MTLQELKNQILDKTVSNSMLVLKYTDNSFLCYQYINQICKDRDLELIHIDSINQAESAMSDIFESETKYLYVYDVESLQDDISNPIENLIIVCKDLNKNYSFDYIEVPKLIEWQIEDYVSIRLKGLDKNQIKWLCEVTQYDIYRLDNECRKIEIFPVPSQKIIFEEINADDGYCDLNTSTILTLSNAIVNRDKNTIKSVLHCLDWIDIESVGLITILHKQFRNIINVQLDSRATAESLGMNPRQFNAIKYNSGKFTGKELVSIYEFLVEFDMRLKKGELQFTLDSKLNNKMLINYINNRII